MAIEPLKKAWLIGPAGQAPEVPERLAAIGLMHVAEAPKQSGEAQAALSSLAADTRPIEANVRKLTETLDILSEYSRSGRDFLSALISTPVETTRNELAEALRAIDIEALHQEAKDLAARRAAAQAAGAKARERLAALGPFRSIQATVPAESALRWTRAALWLAPAALAKALLQNGQLPEGLAIELLGLAGPKALVATVALREDAEEAHARLRDLGLEPVAPPEATAALADHVAGIEAELAEAEKEFAAAQARLAELGTRRHQVELVLGHWEEKLATARALARMVSTGRAALLTGYVRAREAEAFKAAVARELPEATVLLEDPARGENVPVALRNSRFFRPAQFLVEMFGLPSYDAFDPSAFLMASFVVFYGFCLGDAVYGILQVAAAWALARRYRAYPGLRNFFTLLLYCGVTTFAVGVLTGTWAADLFRRELGERSVFGWAALDPLEKPLVALGIALVLGLANQFWGVAMRMYGAWRQGDKWGAVFDGGFWLLLLPGLVLLIAAFFAPEAPAWVPRAGKWLALVGAAGLVFTQGRREKSLVGKIVVGLVSLYGVVGSYGCVTFIGDTLSYSRLLALGLTTTIIGMAVNIIAGLLRFDVAFIGFLVFAAFAAAGHVFNLVLSALGAFIHSARLIFVEFFGRFYEPGAERFAPLGATGGRLRITG